MYIRVTRASYNGVEEDKIQHMVDEQLVPALKKLPGFKHYEGGMNRDAKGFIAISTWDTLEQSQAVMAQRKGFEALGVRFDASETFEATSRA